MIERKSQMPISKRKEKVASKKVKVIEKPKPEARDKEAKKAKADSGNTMFGQPVGPRFQGGIDK